MHRVLLVISGDSVTPGDSVKPVFTGQEAQKEKIDKRLDRSELPVLNSPSRSVQLEHNVHMQPSGIGHTGNPLGIGHTGNRSDQEHGSVRTRHHSDVSRSSRRDSNTRRNTISLQHADPGEHSPASMIRHRPARSRSRSYDFVSPRCHSRLTSRSRGKKKKKHSKSHSSKRDKSKKKHKRKRSPFPPPSHLSSSVSSSSPRRSPARKKLE